MKIQVQPMEAAKCLKARVELGLYMNPMAKQMEIWLRDPDGYRVVVAGPSKYSRQALPA